MKNEITTVILQAPDVGEMAMIAAEAINAGFNRVEIDPDHLLALCHLALTALEEKST